MIEDLEDLPVLDAELVSPKPKNRILRKAIWANTFLMMGLAVASRHLTIANASITATIDSKGNILDGTENYSNDLEVSDEYEIEEYEVGEYEQHHNEVTAPKWRRHHLNSEENDDDIIIVATVDGGIAGLSQLNGELLWKHSGVTPAKNDFQNDGNAKTSDEIKKKILGPLVTTTTTKETSSSHDWRTTAVPSVDGKVFLTASSDTTSTATLKELVARTPYVDSRGRFYVGSRQASAVALNKKNGKILLAVSGENASEDIDSLVDPDVIWIGRVDYSVSVYDAQNGVMDVKFSSSEIIGVRDMLSGNPTGFIDSHHSSRLALPGDNDNDFERESKPSMLVATPNGNVGFRNPITGNIEWVSNESFDAPVAFALEASSGTSLGVDFLPDVPMPSSSLDYLASQLERQINVLATSQKVGQPIVKELSSGQLFAMILGKSFSKQKFPGHKNIGLPSSSSSAIAIGTKPNSGKLPNLGRRPSTSNQQQQVSLARKPCNPSNQNFPDCLVNQESLPLFDEDSFVYRNRGEENNALLPQHQYLYPPDPSEGKFHKNKRNFSKLMGSWLPPTMALLFVLSFEMGRRLKAKKEDTESVFSNNDINSTNNDEIKDDNGIQKVGVITVTDSVLGFGGHGTVVYKGALDGRQVAVKRMLKDYHASANREISLLIESDGHPNVVRYFLKEAKGDFVYLALELCNMSLHDLTIKLRQYTPTVFQRPELLVATKETLYQIASGVRHLHLLRIVHRDLKPANILLALNNRKIKKGTKTTSNNDELVDEDDILSRYTRRDYLAKISDMGLGKQLAGQSSYGLSTFGTSTALGESSRLTGAGPGSVGWQAPEVMASRWSPETTSVKSGDSHSRNGQDSLFDGSPLDITVNSRPSRSVDIFSLGCIFHCMLVPGVHPFGEWFEREANIMRNKQSTNELREASLAAHDLVLSMISRDPSRRPTAKGVCEHPFFWNSQKKLAFLCDISDRIESESQIVGEGKDPVTYFGANIFAIEKYAAEVVGTAWDKCLDPDLISNVSKFRSYDPSSVRDCLRLIRNKHHHYDELPAGVKERVGSNPDGLLSYFESKFPRILMHCYSISKDFMDAKDSLVQKYSIPLSKPVPKDKKILENGSNGMIVSSKDVTFCEEVVTSNPTSTVEVKVNGTPPGETSQQPVESSNSDIGKDNMECNKEGESRKDIPEPSFSSKAILPTNDIVIWESSTAAKAFKCRGWFRGDDEWTRGMDATLKKHDSTLTRCATDPKFRTRLCNHWDMNCGTFCPMRKKKKCIFAHGPVELRVKEGKKNRWGKLVDKSGNNSNPKHSGGEDTYGAARSIESVRKQEGKWNTDKTTASKQKQKRKASNKKSESQPYHQSP